jgi:hypothetical protein
VLAEARSVFPNAVVARDFDHFIIKRGEGAQKVELKPEPVSEGEPDVN